MREFVRYLLSSIKLNSHQFLSHFTLFPLGFVTKPISHILNFMNLFTADILIVNVIPPEAYRNFF